VASVRSLENALEVGTGANVKKVTDDNGVTQIPDNGRIIRNLIHGADTVMSHITHFYHLAALDFVDASALGAPFAPTYTGTTSAVPGLLHRTTQMTNLHWVVTNYVEALAMRRKAHTMSAIFAGRHPIQNAIVPGGVTTLPTECDVFKFSHLLDQIRNFINTAYVQDVVTVANLTSPNYNQYWIGTPPGYMLSYGEYPVQNGTGTEELLFPRAVVRLSGTALSAAYAGAGAPTAFLGNVREHVAYSYYSSPSQLHPSVGKTEPNVSLVADGTNVQQYSWLKAPRFGTSNLVCEVGPIARVIAKYVVGPNHAVSEIAGITLGGTGVAVKPIAGGSPYAFNALAGAVLGLVGKTGAPSALVSILGRHATRAVECKFLADAMADTGIAKGTGLSQQAWLTELRTGGAADGTGNNFANLTNPVYIYAKLPNKPKSGAGWAEAPRGALGHWISIEKKKITNYQCVVPSTWNHSPKDDLGFNGPAEQVINALAPIINLNTWSSDDVILTLLRVMHTYDFCIACAVHVVKPDGSTVAKFRMETDGRVTKLPHDAEI